MSSPHYFILLVLSVAVFLSATTRIPSRVDLGGVGFVLAQDGAIDFLRPSLLVGGPGNDFLNGTLFQDGDFSIEVRLQVGDTRTSLEEFRVIAAYSDSTTGWRHNWALKQDGASLYVEYRGRSTTFANVFGTAQLTHFVAEMRPDGFVSLHRAGVPQETQRLLGSAQHGWDPSGLFTIGNGVTGDYPFIGSITLLRIYNRPLGIGVVADLLEGRPADDVLPTTSAAAVRRIDDKLVLASVVPPDLLIVPYSWRWTLKLQRTFSLRFLWAILSVRDVVQNILLTVPFGFLFASMFGKERFGRMFLLLVFFQLLLSLLAETTQLFDPARTPNPLDLATNTLGAATGAGLCLVYRFVCRLRT